jgi:hypothetical protein
MSLSTILPGASSFVQLEYDLQSTAKSSTLRIQKAWEISNPSLTVAFERKSKVSLQLLPLYYTFHQIF